MRLTYLGLLSKVFNWVFENLLEPVVRTIASIVSSILEVLFNSILMPILTLVFETVYPWVIEMAQELLSSVLYRALAILCQLLDYLEDMFNAFAGVSNVTVNGNSTTLLEAVISMSQIRVFFLVIMLASIILTGLIAIIEVAKSTIDLDMQGKRPVSAVLKSTFKAVMAMVFLPLTIFLIISLANVTLNTIKEAVSIANEGNTTLGRIIFCTATLDAAKDGANISDTSQKVSNYFEVSPRAAYYYEDGSKDYSDGDAVYGDFDVKELMFLEAAVVIYFVGTSLFASILTVIQRIFEVVILGVIAPFFVCFMPVDDGEKFKKWKEMFIAKAFSGYGTILAMQIYFILIPIIMGNSITWGNETAQGVMIIKLVFLCAGAKAFANIGPMVTTMISWQAGQDEYKNVSAMAGLAHGYIGGKVMNKALQGVGGTFGLMSKPFQGVAANASKSADAKWKAMQENFDAHGASARADASEDKGENGGKDGLNIKTDKNAAANGEALKEGANQSGGGKENTKGNANENANENTGEGKKGELESEANLSRFGGTGSAGEPGRFNKALNWFQKTFPCKSDSNGNYKFNFGLVSATYNAKGECTGFKVPFFSFGFDKNHGCRMTGWNIPGVCKAERHGPNSTFQLTSVPLLGVRRKEGQDGQMHVTSALGILERKPALDGTYHTTSFLGIQRNIEFNSSTGHYESSGVRIGNLTFGGGDYSEQLAKDQREAEEEAKKKTNNDDGETVTLKNGKKIKRVH